MMWKQQGESMKPMKLKRRDEPVHLVNAFAGTKNVGETEVGPSQMRVVQLVERRGFEL